MIFFFLLLLLLPQPVKAMHFSKDYEYKNVKVSWYAKGLKNPEAFTTACWNDYPKGTRFRISYRNVNVDVVCNDRGNFRRLGRFLDISAGAFAKLAPLRMGILKVDVEILSW